MKRKKFSKGVIFLAAVLSLLLVFGIRGSAEEDEIMIIDEGLELFMPFGPECGGIVVGGGGSGTALNGWFNINGARYFFVNGVRRTGWFQQGSAWFFLNPPAGTSGHNPNHTIGRMQTGWLQRGSAWYFLNPAAGTSGHNTREDVGRMQRGWLQRGSAWYFLNPAAGSAGHNPNRAYGRMLTGWLSRNGNYYFLNPAAGTSGHNPNQAYGRMQVGLLQRGSNRYFLHTTSGRMQTGWVNRSGHYYFFNPASGVAGHNRDRPHGVMLTGWLSRNSNWYFLDTTSGRMQRGWLRTGGDWFFLNNSGRMQTGTITLNGFSYTLNSSGRLQGNGTRSWDPAPDRLDNTNINVTASGTWSVNSNVNWLTISNVSPASRNGNGSFRINSIVGTTNSLRSGTITITAPGEPPRIINVRQEGLIWHSDSSSVSFWPGVIRIHTRTVGSVSEGFQFPTRVNEARIAWRDALGVRIDNTSNESDAQILAFGGSRDQITRLRRGNFSSELAGLATTTAVRVGTVNINNTTKNVSRLSSARIYVVERPSVGENWTRRNTEMSKMITAHELGHALGFRGHPRKVDANRQDVMWYTISQHYTLRENEIRHLRQIYSIFR